MWLGFQHVNPDAVVNVETPKEDPNVASVESTVDSNDHYVFSDNHLELIEDLFLGLSARAKMLERCQESFNVIQRCINGEATHGRAGVLSPRLFTAKTEADKMLLALAPSD